MSQQVENREHVGARRKGVGVAALVVGVLSLVLALLVLFFPIAALLGLIAIILRTTSRQFGNCKLGADNEQQTKDCGRTLTDKLDQQ
jgi:hypothetical protein